MSSIPAPSTATAAVPSGSSNPPTAAAALAPNGLMNANIYALLSAQKVLQWHQEHHRTDAQSTYVKNALQSLLTAPNMFNGHEPSSSQSISSGTVPSCNGCQSLTREIEELKRMLILIMDSKPDLNLPTLCNNLHLLGGPSGQSSVPPQQQPFSDNPFAASTMQSLPLSLLRLVVNGYLQQQQQQQPQNGFHLPSVQMGAELPFWQAAANAAASASTSGNNNRDLAQRVASVDMEVDNNFGDRGIGNIDGNGTSSAPSSANAQIIPQSSESRTTQNHNVNVSVLSMLSQNDNLLNMAAVQRAAAVAPLLNLGHMSGSLPPGLTANPNFVAAVAAAHAAQNQVLNRGQQAPCVPMQMPSTLMTPSTQLRSSVRMPAERPMVANGLVERKKPNSDDFIKNLRQRNMSPEEICKIQIPVPEALKYDQNFRPLSEEQIIQQIKSSKKFESMDTSDAMVQLCKKLAEKRVFGTRLMAETTVAAPNHSSYANLPDDGIIYILHVCRKVLVHHVKDEEDFFNFFRDAMKKLAARCRRVRHSKKVSKSRDLALSPEIESSSANVLLDVQAHLSPSIFAHAQSLVGDDEHSSRSSTASNSHVPSSSFETTASPETPPSMMVTPSSSRTPPSSSSSASN